jgi:hypothetical protein
LGSNQRPMWAQSRITRVGRTEEWQVPATHRFGSYRPKSSVKTVFDDGTQFNGGGCVQPALSR